MKYEDVEKLTTDEVRVVVAKARGYFVEECWVNGVGGFGKLNWPDRESFDEGKVLQTTDIENYVNYLPDLSDPREYMALWDEITEANTSFALFNDRVVGVSGVFRFGPEFDIKDRCEAISRAWLVVCGGE